MLLQEHQKGKLLSKINQTIFQSQVINVNQDIQDACEIVHYSIMNNIPVDLKYVYLINPDFNEDIDKQKAYYHNEWLKNKQGLDSEQLQIEIEDNFNLKEGKRGRKDQQEWNIQGGSDSFNFNEIDPSKIKK